jgi:hypothetical protein
MPNADALILIHPIGLPRLHRAATTKVISCPLYQKIRILIGLFIIGLILSGITAFPLLHELNILCAILGAPNVHQPDGYAGLTGWILLVRQGLEQTYSRYPFIAYGTDWLAFGHLTISIFFIGPWIDPVRNIWVLRAGMLACIGVIPLALICGPIRDIPIYWRLIDCSFGIVGFIPLWLALKLTLKL